MLKFTRLGVVLHPQKGDDGAEFVEGRKGEWAKYNAGMTYDGKKVHMLYRNSRNRKAAGWDPTRQSPYSEDFVGYAELTPEGKLVKDHGAVIKPSHPLEVSGCQDPRVVAFEGEYIITYCAWNKDAVPAGQDKARMGFARTKDFKTYKLLGIVDHYAWDKDHYIFPERINGKICLVHRVEPDIQIEYFKSFEAMLDPAYWKDYDGKVGAAISLKSQYPWEGQKVGGSVPPIKTAQGWLFLYHGVERFPKGAEFPFRYSAGAALMDLAEPHKAIARLPYPILTPEADYEKYGDVNNVVFPVGGYVYKGELYISYGGADKVVAIAKCSLDALLKELLAHKIS